MTCNATPTPTVRELFYDFLGGYRWLKNLVGLRIWSIFISIILVAASLNSTAYYGLGQRSSMKEANASQDNNTLHEYKYRYISRTGKTVIDAGRYMRIESFSDGLAAVCLANVGWGYIDQNGKVIIEPQFEQALSFHEGLAGVQIGGSWGFINKTGAMVIEPQYEFVNSFSEGIAVVAKGEQKVSPVPIGSDTIEVERITTILDIHEGKLSHDNLLQKGGKEVFLVDKGGNMVLSSGLNNSIQIALYDNAVFSEGLIGVYDRAKKKYGFVNKIGKLVIEANYDQVAPFSAGLARVAVVKDGEEKVGFIDHSGQFIVPPSFNTDADFARTSTNFSEGIAGLTEGGRPTITGDAGYVYIDMTGDIILSTEFFYGGPFRDGLACVYDAESNKWGFIDKSGKLLMPLQYDLANDFSEGLAVVAILGK